MRLTRAVNKKKVLVVGGGSGGISTAARLARSRKYDISIIDSAKMHYYQPLWTLVGGGQINLESTGKPMNQLIPKHVEHIPDDVSRFSPKENSVTLKCGRKLPYDALVIAVGLELNYKGIPGLVEGLENDKRIGSNYSTQYVNKTAQAVEEFKGGNAIFTFPTMPIKCPGAPQKIMWIANDIWKNKSDVAGKYTVEFNTGLPVIFGIPKYANELMKSVESEKINFNKESRLTEVDHVKGVASFTQSDGSIKDSEYDFLHVTPPQRPLELLRLDDNNLTSDEGWVTVNPQTMQHTVFDNVFSLGDCSNLPTSKTAAGITMQHVVAAQNITHFFEGTDFRNDYNGYTSCPLITSQNTCMMAEFGYNGELMETFPIDQGKNRKSMYQFKRHVLPKVYWTAMMSGYYTGAGPWKKILNPTNRQ